MGFVIGSVIVFVALLWLGIWAFRLLPDANQPGKIVYLDGLRGVAAIVVVLFHFLLGGYPAITSGNPAIAHSPLEAWLAYTPLYLLYSGSFSVAIFFVMSGFVLSYPFFLKKQWEIPISGACRRYLRLALPVLLTTTLYFVLMKTGVLSPNILKAVSHYSYSELMRSVYDFKPDLLGMLKESLYNVFFLGQYQYNPVLWTMKIEFFGSLLVFAFLLLMGRNPKRWIGYLLLLFLVRTPQYLAFVFGMGLSDLVAHGHLQKLKHPISLGLMLALGIYCAAFPHYMDPAFISQTTYSWIDTLVWLQDQSKPWFVMTLGATLLLIVVLNSRRIQKFLSSPLCQFLGKISFALYLTHFAVLCTLTATLFLELKQFLPYHLSALLSFIISVPVMLAVATLTYYWIDKPSLDLAGKFYKTWMRPKLLVLWTRLKTRFFDKEKSWESARAE